MAITLLGARRRRRRRKAAGSTACKTSRGRLKKGWRYGKGGRCIKAKGTKARRKRRRR
jgi:hypothetical protein